MSSAASESKLAPLQDQKLQDQKLQDQKLQDQKPQDQKLQEQKSLTMSQVITIQSLPSNLDAKMITTDPKLIAEYLEDNRRQFGKYNCPHVKSREEAYFEHCKTRSHCSCLLSHYEETDSRNVDELAENGYVNAILMAYNNHKGLKFTPNDVWTQIILFLSEYMQANADSVILAKLVLPASAWVSDRKSDDNGTETLPPKKNLEVVTDDQRDFFSLIEAEIAKHMAFSFVNLISAPFSTTTAVQSRILSTALMSASKAYFAFTMTYKCGITSVHLTGTLKDWNDVRSRTAALAVYDVDGKLKEFLKPLDVVLSQFEQTYQNNVDVSWWNQVFNFWEGREGSGPVTKASGWVLAFFGLMGKRVNVADIPIRLFRTPFTKRNYGAPGKQECMITAGFGGVVYADGAFSPQQCLSVVEIGKVIQYDTPCTV